ncbi:MAG: argininosuccinate synthase, partial [Candidatus Bathyarchaeia archaeon]
LLIEAHKDLEKIVLSKHELAFKQYVDTQWAYLAYNGLWLEPLKEDLDAFIEKSQERVFGKVRIKLYAGGLSIVGRSSPYSLYDLNLATYDIRTTFDQSWSKGFIEVWGLPTVIANILKSKIERKRKKV